MFFFIPKMAGKMPVFLSFCLLVILLILPIMPILCWTRAFVLNIRISSRHNFHEHYANPYYIVWKISRLNIVNFGSCAEPCAMHEYPITWMIVYFTASVTFPCSLHAVVPITAAVYTIIARGYWHCHRQHQVNNVTFLKWFWGIPAGALFTKDHIKRHFYPRQRKFGDGREFSSIEAGVTNVSCIQRPN